MAEFFNEPARSWDVLAQQRERALERVAALTEAELRSGPLEAIAGELCRRFSLDVPVLDEAAATASRREVMLDPTRANRRFGAGRPTAARGLRVTVAVPYTGDRRVLELRPDTYENITPRGEITDTAILFHAEGASLDPDAVRADYESWLGLVRRNLELHRRKLGGFNETLPALVSSALDERVATLQEHQSVIDRLGLPLAA